MSLDDDLARWEAGYLSREELIASYASSEKNLAEPSRRLREEPRAQPREEPGKILTEPRLPDVAPELALVKMLDLHEQLVDIGSEPVPYHESDWEQLRDSLPDRLPHSSGLRYGSPRAAAHRRVHGGRPDGRRRGRITDGARTHGLRLARDPAHIGAGRTHPTPSRGTVSDQPRLLRAPGRPRRRWPGRNDRAMATQAVAPATAVATAPAAVTAAPATPTARPVAATPRSPVTRRVNLPVG